MQGHPGKITALVQKNGFFLSGILLSFFLAMVFPLIFALASEGLRKHIIVYKYVGPEPQFNSFFYFLTSRTENLLSELYAPDKDLKEDRLSKLKYLKDIEFSMQDNPFELSHPKPEKLKEYWDTNHALGILFGTIGERDDKLSVHTSVFFGDLQGRYKKPLLNIMDDLSSTQSARFLNSHHLATFYSLAMDAKINNKPKWLVGELFGKARLIGKELEASYNDEINEIISAIDWELEKLEE